MAENTTFQAPAYTADGATRATVELPSTPFDGTVNMPVMHQAVKAFLANQRQGNASTKVRKYVIGGNQKPWKQKGTGRARQGSTRAPHWVGGGTVFGPLPRSYAQYVPRQVRALARKSALNARAREDAIYVIDRLDFDAPKTARLQALVDSIGVADQKVLILTDGAKPNVFLSGRNLPAVHVMPYQDVSTYHILWSDVVLIEAGAIGQEVTGEGRGEPTVRPSKRAAKKTKADAAPATAAAGKGKRAAKKATKSAAKKSAKKTAAKKSARRPSSAARRPKRK
jgi:large subunit ribosomal protein L4